MINQLFKKMMILNLRRLTARKSLSKNLEYTWMKYKKFLFRKGLFYKENKVQRSRKGKYKILKEIIKL